MFTDWIADNIHVHNSEFILESSASFITTVYM